MSNTNMLEVISETRTKIHTLSVRYKGNSATIFKTSDEEENGYILSSRFGKQAGFITPHNAAAAFTGMIDSLFT